MGSSTNFGDKGGDVFMGHSTSAGMHITASNNTNLANSYTLTTANTLQ